MPHPADNTPAEVDDFDRIGTAKSNMSANRPAQRDPGSSLSSSISGEQLLYTGLRPHGRVRFSVPNGSTTEVRS